MRVVAVLNQKGGVGKTTTAVNLGAALALRDERVLLIDLDPQGNLTDHLGIELGEDTRTAYDVLTGDATVKQAVLPTATRGLYVLPSSQDLAGVELELAEAPGRELRLKTALAALGPKAYDWVLIDCPPSLGLLSLNAMAAASEVFITLQTEYFALRGLGQLDRIVQLVREQVNPTLLISGIVATLVDPVTNLAREVIEEVQKVYGHRVFATRIRKNVRLAEAPGHGTHIFAYEPTCSGAADYHALADEVEAWVPGGAQVQAPTPAAPAKAKVPVAIPVEAPSKPPPARKPAAHSAPTSPPASKTAAAKAAPPKAEQARPAPPKAEAAKPEAPKPPAPPAVVKPAPGAKAAAPAAVAKPEPPAKADRLAKPTPPPAPPARPAVPTPALRHQRPWMKPGGGA